MPDVTNHVIDDSTLDTTFFEICGEHKGRRLIRGTIRMICLLDVTEAGTGSLRSSPKWDPLEIHSS